jgi:FAD/FMN-containing dehydrogenase
MSVFDVNTTSELAAAHELRASRQGSVVLRGDDDYPRARKIWNRAVESVPALVALCETAADVQAAVRVARRHGLPLSVRGAGHHWAGLALRPDGLVIDLSTMSQVIVDPHSRVATVAGGAKVKDVVAPADAHGLVAALGNCGEVGVAGLTLGGGYGPQTALYGLAADNLQGAAQELALASRVTAGPDPVP